MMMMSTLLDIPCRHYNNLTLIALLWHHVAQFIGYVSVITMPEVRVHAEPEYKRLRDLLRIFYIFLKKIFTNYLIMKDFYKLSY